MIRHLNPPGPGLLPRTVSAEAHAGAQHRPSGLSERLTHASHQYLLPAVGAGAATLGGVLLLGAGASTRPFLPFALVGLGAAAVASSVAFHHWQYRRSISPTPPPMATVPPAVRDEPYGRASSVPHSGIGRAATATVAAAGETIWRQWDSPSTGSLGATLTGPVAESAYVPSAIGHPGPYADRDEGLMFYPLAALPRPAPLRGSVGVPGAPRRVPVPTVRSAANARARLAARRRVPFSDAELDALFPPDRSPPPMAAPMPLATAEFSPIPFPRATLALEIDSIALPSTGSRPSSSGSRAVAADLPPEEAPEFDEGAQPSGRFRILPSLLSLRDPLYVETIHPLPPHLRSSVPRGGGRVAGARATSTPHPVGDRSTECVGCFRSLSGFRGWVMCPGCHGPLCRRCLGASFMASPEGQCSRCRPWHAHSAN
jgi:hypothetical protein